MMMKLHISPAKCSDVAHKIPVQDLLVCLQGWYEITQ